YHFIYHISRFLKPQDGFVLSTLTKDSIKNFKAYENSLKEYLHNNYIIIEEYNNTKGKIRELYDQYMGKLIICDKFFSDIVKLPTNKITHLKLNNCVIEYYCEIPDHLEYVKVD